jgi:hypothetical protein
MRGCTSPLTSMQVQQSPQGSSSDEHFLHVPVSTLQYCSPSQGQAPQGRLSPHLHSASSPQAEKNRAQTKVPNTFHIIGLASSRLHSPRIPPRMWLLLSKNHLQQQASAFNLIDNHQIVNIKTNAKQR